MLFSFKSPHQIRKSPDSMTVKYILVHIEDEPFLLMVHIVCSGHKPTQTHDTKVPTKTNDYVFIRINAFTNKKNSVNKSIKKI